MPVWSQTSHHRDVRGSRIPKDGFEHHMQTTSRIRTLRLGMKSGLLASLLSVGSLVAPTQTDAATYDPDLTWRTIVTEHFRIHFHQGEEQLAEEFTHMVEDVFDTMTEELVWVPKGKTDVVLIDRTDDANGYARVVPYLE